MHHSLYVLSLHGVVLSLGEGHGEQRFETIFAVVVPSTMSSTWSSWPLLAGFWPSCSGQGFGPSSQMATLMRDRSCS